TGQAQLLCHPRPDEPGDGTAVPEKAEGSRHVEERLVDPDSLDPWGDRVEDGVQLGALLDVAVVATVEEDSLGTESPRDGARHSRVHPEPPRLVGAGSDDAALTTAAHDDRLPGQGRI